MEHRRIHPPAESCESHPPATPLHGAAEGSRNLLIALVALDGALPVQSGLFDISRIIYDAWSVQLLRDASAFDHKGLVDELVLAGSTSHAAYLSTQVEKQATKDDAAGLPQVFKDELSPIIQSTVEELFSRPALESEYLVTLLDGLKAMNPSFDIRPGFMVCSMLAHGQSKTSSEHWSPWRTCRQAALQFRS